MIKPGKSKKKIVSLGVVHIQATFNNTIVTFTDVQGNTLVSSSAGSEGFKGAKKSTPYAAQCVIDNLSKKAREYGLKTVSIKIKGPGSQRELALRSVFHQNFIVTSIEDVSPIAHNGCKSPKRRRV